RDIRRVLRRGRAFLEVVEAPLCRLLFERFAFDELVEHISRQLGHAHAMGVGDRPELVARGPSSARR
ncbi:MAG: hypothetical protein WBW27_05685, partial [Pseudolabrys sp.]